MGMTRKCPKSDCFVICNGDCLHCERTYFGRVIEVSEVSDGCEFCLNNKFEAVGLNDHGVYLSCGNSRPPEHEKFRFCPNCGRKL